jgi:hypothetical protein
MTHHRTQAVDNHGTVYQQPGKPLAAPEINASEGLTAVLLLAGMLAVLMGKRRA